MASKIFFWQEIFSTVTMLVPSIYIAYRFQQHDAIPTRLRLMAWATYLHCFASCMYHCHCAANANRHDFNCLESPWRTADFTMIHLCLLSYTHAVSGDLWYFDLLALILNLISAGVFIQRQVASRPGSKADALRVMAGICIYLAAMLCRGDLSNCGGVACAYGVGAIFYHKNDALGRWGHGLFHLALVPCTHFVLKSSVASLGDACPALF